MLFDGDKLTFVSLSNVSEEDLLQATSRSQDLIQDSTDADSESTTNQYLNVAYVDFSGEFKAPIGPLFKVKFKPSGSNLSGTTKINFALVTAAGISAETSSITVNF
jgi:hypothetical protein